MLKCRVVCVSGLRNYSLSGDVMCVLFVWCAPLFVLQTVAVAAAAGVPERAGRPSDLAGISFESLAALPWWRAGSLSPRVGGLI